jgi:hypothetical protein
LRLGVLCDAHVKIRSDNFRKIGSSLCVFFAVLRALCG